MTHPLLRTASILLVISGGAGCSMGWSATPRTGADAVPGAAPVTTTQTQPPATTPPPQTPANTAPSDACNTLGASMQRPECHAPERFCATAPMLADPATAAWTTQVHSTALVVASDALATQGNPPEPSLFFTASLPEDSVVAVRSAIAAEVTGGSCDAPQVLSPTEEFGCGATHVALYAVRKGSVFVRFHGTRDDVVDATVQAFPVPDHAGAVALHHWGDAAPFYLGVYANDPASRWVPACGTDPRPWSVEGIVGCEVPPRVRLTTNGAPGVQVASERGDGSAVCATAGTLEFQPDAHDIVHRITASAGAGAGFGGTWVTLAAE